MKLENLTVDGHSIRNSDGAIVAVAMDVGTAEKITVMLNTYSQLVLALTAAEATLRLEGFEDDANEALVTLIAAGAQP